MQKEILEIIFKQALINQNYFVILLFKIIFKLFARYNFMVYNVLYALQNKNLFFSFIKLI